MLQFIPEARMETSHKEIEKRMELLNDETLLKIITEDFDEYTDEALQIAKKELEKRQISIKDYVAQKRFEYIVKNTDIAVDDLVQLKDIIVKPDYSLIEEAFVKNYPDDQEFKEEYKNLYEQLLKMQPTECKNILVTIERQIDDINDSEIAIWNINGIDTQTGERKNLELFKWNEWLSFYVNIKNLQEIGMENYIAHCFYKMTINGFNEKDIKRNLEMKATESICDFVTFETVDSKDSDTVGKDGIQALLEYKDNVFSKEVPQIRPWVRLWARGIDSLTVLLFLLIIIFVIPLDISQKILSLILSPIILIFIEALLLSKYGTTLGKLILNVKVRNQEGNKLSFKKALHRSFLVWIFGEALGAKTLNTFAHLVAYFRLTRIGKTYWDDKSESTVSHGKIGILKGFIAFILIIVNLVIIARLSLIKYY